jgi:hypothetical protein
MSLKEVQRYVHDLTNCFQVVLSAIESQEYSVALSEIRKAMPIMFRIQTLVRLLEEERRGSHGRKQ